MPNHFSPAGKVRKRLDIFVNYMNIFKKNNLQISIRIGNGNVENDYAIDFVHITFTNCTK